MIDPSEIAAIDAALERFNRQYDDFVVLARHGVASGEVAKHFDEAYVDFVQAVMRVKLLATMGDNAPHQAGPIASALLGNPLPEPVARCALCGRTGPIQYVTGVGFACEACRPTARERRDALPEALPGNAPPVLVPHSSPKLTAADSKLLGYTGDACGGCGNFTLVRIGTCVQCRSCQWHSGCS